MMAALIAIAPPVSKGTGLREGPGKASEPQKQPQLTPLHPERPTPAQRVMPGLV